MRIYAPLLALALAAISFGQTAGPAASAGAKPIAAPAYKEKGQHKGISAKEREKIRDEVLVELNVGTEKTLKVKDLDAELKAKMKADHKADKGLPTEDRKKEAKELHEWYQRKMKEILGEETYEKFRALMKEKLREARKAEEAKSATSKP